jgi:hypothetical protein
MGTPRSNECARLKPWIDDYLRIRAPELVEPFIKALSSYDTVQNSGRLLPENLESIVTAASSSRRPLLEGITDYLGFLSRDWPEARESILEMSRSKYSHVRFNAILCLWKETPAEIINEVLKRSLSDKSARVRGKAADWMGRLRYRYLLPELGMALTAEKSQGTREAMQFEFSLLSDGYILTSMADGQLSLTVHTDNGGCRSAYFDKEKLDKTGVEALAADLRRAV